MDESNRTPTTKKIHDQKKDSFLRISRINSSCFFLFIFLQQAQQILEEKAGGQMSKSLELSISWLDETLLGAVRLSAVIESEPLTRNFLLDHQQISLTEQDALDIMAFQNQLDNILKTESRATSIWIYFPYTNEVISTRFGIYKATDHIALNWMLKQSDEGRFKYWIYPDATHSMPAGSLLDLTPARESGNQQITFVRSVPGIGMQHMPVIIGVGYLEYTILDLLGEAAKKAESSLMLFNEHGNEVLRTGDMIGKYLGIKPSLLNQQKENYYIDKDWLVARSQSKLTGWSIVSVAPLKDFMGGLQLLSTLTYVYGFIAIFLALWMGHLLIQSVHVPLKQLLTEMKKVEAGDLSARVKYVQTDEFGVVAEGFNQMVETQDQLIRTGYQERIARQQAELSYLTNQINPHFLYNTLGALYSMAKRVDKHLANSLMVMSKLFRASLNQGENTRSVVETIEHIAHYIHLLNIRTPDKYHLDVYMEPGSEQFQIPSLIVQPIVENAVKHGLETISRQGVIRINFTLLRSNLLISISDNGVGMSDDQLNKLRQFIQNFHAMEGLYNDLGAKEAKDGFEGSGYALKNIYRRLQLKYGQNFVFSIESSEGKGTHITIRIPKGDGNNDEASYRG